MVFDGDKVSVLSQPCVVLHFIENEKEMFIAGRTRV